MKTLRHVVALLILALMIISIVIAITSAFAVFVAVTIAVTILFGIAKLTRTHRHIERMIVETIEP